MHVVAALIENEHGQVLIAQRPAGRHHAGLWEFPGGKIDPGETPFDALRRELREELVIDIKSAVRVMTVVEPRPEGDLHLQAWRVLEYDGVPHAVEASGLRWIDPLQFVTSEMPPADHPIARCLQLPPHFVITPDLADVTPRTAFEWVHGARASGARLIRLRSADPAFRPDAGLLRDCEQDLAAVGGRIVVDLADLDRCQLAQTGIHLRSRDLRGRGRPVAESRLLSASCHSEAELEAAEQLGADVVLISPVLATASHPDHAPLGWSGFQKLHAHTRLPAYALGGIKTEHLALALAQGAIGTAGISQFSTGT